MKWSEDADACITNAVARVGEDIRSWFMLFPITRPLVAATPAPGANDIPTSVADTIRASLYADARDPHRFVGGGDATKSALLRGRRLALERAFVLKPIQPLLAEFANVSADGATDYRILLWCYRDGKSLREIGEMSEIRAALAPLTVTSPAFAQKVRERVLAAYRAWHEVVRERYPPPAGTPAFPPPEQLR